MNDMSGAYATGTERATGSGAMSNRSSEMQRFFADVEELIGRTPSINDSELETLKSRVSSGMQELRALRDTETARRLRDASMNAASTANAFAHERPWATVGMAALIGAVVGAALSRR
jgi:ElaB/YqjD/DUF883 family membrane-anchored ribosome-binding protein